MKRAAEESESFGAKNVANVIRLHENGRIYMLDGLYVYADDLHAALVRRIRQVLVPV